MREWFEPATGQLVERVTGQLPVEPTPTYDDLVAELTARCVCEHVDVGIGLMKVEEVPDCPACCAPAEKAAALPADVADVVRELSRPGVNVVEVVQFDPEPCDWCALDGHVTTVRVYGEPAEGDPHNPLRLAETCRCCASDAMRQARAEQNPNSDNDIQVEVCK